jgi:hypothetical protein
MKHHCNYLFKVVFILRYKKYIKKNERIGWTRNIKSRYTYAMRLARLAHKKPWHQ